MSTKGASNTWGVLERARGAWRGAEITRAVATWLAPLLAALLLFFLVDNLFVLAGWLRLALLVVWLLAAGVGFFVLVLPPLGRRRSLEATARFVEERLEVPGNVLINAIQLSAEAKNGNGHVPEAALSEVRARAQRAAGHVDVGRVWRAKPLVRSLQAAGVALLLVLGYALLFPDQAANAFARFRSPLGTTGPLTNVRLAVEPGDVKVLAGQTVDVRAVVTARHGTPPRVATIEVRGVGEPWERRTMALAELSHAAFTFSTPLGPVEKETQYRVLAGDARSPTFGVGVVRPPAVTGVRVSLTPPAYTGLPTEEITDPTVIRGLRGTGAKIAFAFDRTPLETAFEVPGEKAIQADVGAREHEAFFGFTLSDAGTLRLRLRDPAQKGESHEAFTVPLTVLEDAPPKVRLRSEAPAQILPPGATLPLSAEAEDDYGLAALRFRVERVSTGAATDLKSWAYPAPGERKVVERLVLPLAADAFQPGESYRFTAEAADHHPAGDHVVLSDAVVVRIARVGELQVPGQSPLSAPFEALRQLVERQRRAVAQTSGLIELRDEHVAKGRYATRASEMAKAQASIRTDALALAKTFAGLSGGSDAAHTLVALDGGPYRELAVALAPLTAAAANEVVDQALHLALPLQQKALAILESLLGRLALESAKTTKETAPDEAGGRSLAEDLRKKAELLKEFLDEQRKLVELSKGLDQKNPEDWTDEDDHVLGRLEAQELAWAKFFEEAFTDLSKVPDQDFASSDLLDEFNQVYMEVKKAADALSEHKVQIAVPLEQSGLELADKLENNLERWIPDTPDHTKWEMEEPEGDMEVPLADLPDELEDIVGDLIDDADKMDDSVEDVSSSWMDSLDKGAGWDATDGPISDMSAKGITGNRLPNSNEIGGRSGEGRTGKSHGQFVEKTAEGKGGRETPTRLTEDAFESGSVKDSSNEAQGGSTGGGKLAGEGMQGLRGRAPPDIQQKLDRLANHQGELRQRAERLSRVLRKLHLPAGDVEDAAALLGWSENHLRNAVGFDLRAAQSNLKAALERARGSLHYEAETLREHGPDLPPRVKDELMESLKRGLPTGYEDVLRAYYQAVAEGK